MAGNKYVYGCTRNGAYGVGIVQKSRLGLSFPFILQRNDYGAYQERIGKAALPHMYFVRK